MKNHFSEPMNCVLLCDNWLGEDHHHKPRFMMITRRSSPGRTTTPMNQVGNDQQNFPQMLTLSIGCQSKDHTARCMIKLSSNGISLPPIICFSSSIFHLFNCLLGIISDTHRSYRVTSFLLVSLFISHALSYIVCHLSIRCLSLVSSSIDHLYQLPDPHHLYQHHTYNTKIASSQHHPLFASSHVKMVLSQI